MHRGDEGGEEGKWGGANISGVGEWGSHVNCTELGTMSFLISIGCSVVTYALISYEHTTSRVIRISTITPYSL